MGRGKKKEMIHNDRKRIPRDSLGNYECFYFLVSVQLLCHNYSVLLRSMENVLQFDYPSSDPPSTPFDEPGDDSLDSAIPTQCPFTLLPSCLLVTPRFSPHSFDPSLLCSACPRLSIPRSSPAILVSAQEQCPQQLRGSTLFGRQKESPASDRMSGAAHHLDCGNLC